MLYQTSGVKHSPALRLAKNQNVIQVEEDPYSLATKGHILGESVQCQSAQTESSGICLTSLERLIFCGIGYERV